MIKVVFLAGPYRANTIYGIKRNIDLAHKYAAALWSLGFAVICPHSNSAFMDGLCEDAVFLDGMQEILRRCDFIYVMPNSEKSSGTQAELKLARAMHIPTLNDRLDEKDAQKIINHITNGPKEKKIAQTKKN